MTVNIFKYKLNSFLLIPNYGNKLTWIFDPLLVSREIVGSPGIIAGIIDTHQAF